METKGILLAALFTIVFYGCGGGNKNQPPPPIPSNTNTTTVVPGNPGVCSCAGHYGSIYADPNPNVWKPDRTFKVGESFQIHVYANYSCSDCDESTSKAVDITTKCSWSSSNTSVISVEQGLLVAKQTGDADIKATGCPYYSYGNNYTGSFMWNFLILENSATPPTVNLIPNKTSGKVPLEVIFSITCNDSDGSCVNYSITFGDGTSNQTGSISDVVKVDITHVYSSTGKKTAVVTVKDTDNQTATASQTIDVLP